MLPVLHLALFHLGIVANGLSIGQGSGSSMFDIIVRLEDIIEDKYNKPVPEMVEEQGYKCEVYSYETRDGYINTMHRIRPKAGASGGGRAVLLQHGLLGTSADFVMGGPENSLGYYLADLGHDVWLNNARGNEYSRKHRNLTVSDKKYWQFSFDEIGKYDVPAAVDLMLRTTGAKKIVYVGHSMGTTVFWVAMNENEHLNEKIETMIALAPVAKVAHMKSPIRFLAPFIREAEALFRLLGINEFAPANGVTEWFAKYVCDETMIQLKVCENVLFLLTGYDNAQTNTTLLPYILGHEPGGTSARTVIHFAQLVDSGRFCKYDHQSDAANKKAYNSTTPPDYDLNKVKVPVAMMWADNDWLADTRDVKFLINGLPRIALNYEVPYAKFNHVDFIWALDAKKLVFDEVRDFLKTLP